MKKTAVIILADGFEEIEAVTPIDILRRSGVDVIVAGLSNREVTGARNMVIKTDCLLKDTPEEFDALILPGGSKGAENLANSRETADLIKKQNKQGKIVAAICAAPALVLNPTGVLSEKTATCFPGLEKKFNSDVKFSEDCVVIDGNIITSRGAGTAFEFALSIVKVMMGEEAAKKAGKETIYYI